MGSESSYSIDQMESEMYSNYLKQQVTKAKAPSPNVSKSNLPSHKTSILRIENTGVLGLIFLMLIVGCAPNKQSPFRTFWAPGQCTVACPLRTTGVFASGWTK